MRLQTSPKSIERRWGSHVHVDGVFFARILDSHIPMSLEKPPKFNEYDTKGDPDKHVQVLDDYLYYFHVVMAEK